MQLKNVELHLFMGGWGVFDVMSNIYCHPDSDVELGYALLVMAFYYFETWMSQSQVQAPDMPRIKVFFISHTIDKSCPLLVLVYIFSQVLIFRHI